MQRELDISDGYTPKGGKVVSVLVPIPSEGPYSYRAPEGLDLSPGDFVQVPLGPRKVAAVVWDDKTFPPTAKPVDPAKLRDVELKFDCPRLSADMRKFVDWIADYTVSPPGMVLKMVLRVPAALDPEPPMAGIRLVANDVERMTEARRRVIEIAGDGMAWTRSGLAHAAGVSTSVVEGLRKLEAFEDVEIPPPPAVAPPQTGNHHSELNIDQQQASKALKNAIAAGNYSAILLEGVTGSGKTEVYFEAVEATINEGRQVLILLPEIALTSGFVDRFETRFHAPPAVWNSGMAPRQRERVWRQVAEGGLQVVAGARSALMLPFSNLGLIIVDEEHDSAYKQEDRIFYNARDMAVLRASIGGFPIVLASATPSIESKVNAEQERYQHLELPERQGDAVLPELSLIDLRKHPPTRGQFLSPVLLEATRQALARGEQSLLFLNRRGYAPLTLCRICGFRFECENCSAWLVEHRFRGQLQCHHCGHGEPVPEACPNCGTLDHLAACGPGVERLAEEADHHFPDARIIVLSSDMLGGTSRLQVELEAIAKGEADIIIGTQLVAKGHNFPLLTCVGVVDADLGLANGDPRAAERSFQVLSQVTGRAGRFGRQAFGYLQTYNPENPVLAAIAAGESETFYEREIALRRNANLPPFARLTALIISGTDKNETANYAKALRNSAPVNGDVMVLGPAEAPMALIRGRHRFRLLVHAPRSFSVQSYLRSWISAGPKPRGSIRVQIDIDPQSFL